MNGASRSSCSGPRLLTGTLEHRGTRRPRAEQRCVRRQDVTRPNREVRRVADRHPVLHARRGPRRRRTGRARPRAPAHSTGSTAVRRPPPSRPPRSMSAGARSATVAGRFEAQHGGRHRHVEALGAAAMLDAHPLGDRRVVVEAGRLVAATMAIRPVQSASVCDDAAVRRRADQSQAGPWTTSAAQPGTTGRGTPLRRTTAAPSGWSRPPCPGVTTTASDAGGLGRANDRAEVAGLGDTVGHDDERRRRRARSDRPARSRDDGEQSRSTSPGRTPARRRRGRARRPGPASIDRIFAGCDVVRLDRPAGGDRLGDQRPGPRRRTHLRPNANCGARSGAAVAEPWGS